MNYHQYKINFLIDLIWAVSQIEGEKSHLGKLLMKKLKPENQGVSNPHCSGVC